MQTKQDYEMWTKWCARKGLSEEERMRLDIVDTVLTAYAKEHPWYLATNADIKEWIFMPKSTLEIVDELRPVMHLEPFDVVLWLRSHAYHLVLGSSGLLEWAMYERRYIDE